MWRGRKGQGWVWWAGENSIPSSRPWQCILLGSCNLNRIWGSVFVLLSPIFRISLPNIMTHMFPVTIIDYICNINYIISEFHLQILHFIPHILPPPQRRQAVNPHPLWEAYATVGKMWEKRLCIPVTMLAVIHTHIHFISSVVLH